MNILANLLDLRRIAIEVAAVAAILLLALRAGAAQPCHLKHVTVYESDRNGVELVRVVPYAMCDEGARPSLPNARELCFSEGNPFGWVIWADPRDWEQVRWLCNR